MTHRIRTIAAANAAALASLTGALWSPAATAASSFHVEPTPNCITMQEWKPLELNPAISRDQMEKLLTSGPRVNLTRKAEHVGTHNAYLYRACGYSFDEVQILVMTERMGRPGADESRKPGNRIVVSGAWWVLPEGYVCGDGCTPGGYNDLLDDDDGIPDNYVRIAA